MSISSPGIGSGLDIGSIVSQLVAAEGNAALTRFATKEVGYQAEISAYGLLKSALSDFQLTVTGLSTLSEFQNRIAASSNTDVFTTSADETAVTSEYLLEVVQLAKPNKLISKDGYFTSGSATVGAGVLKITQDASSFSLTIAATDTLEDVRTAINDATDNTGVTASIINVDDGIGGTESKLVLTSQSTGTSEAIIIEVDEDSNSIFNDPGDLDTIGLSRLINANLDEVTQAQDGQIKVDGQLVSSSSNSFDSVISGVAITAVSVGAGETLSVDKDKGSINSKIKSFVDSYNALVETFNKLTSFDAATQSAGTLLGDSTLRTVQSTLRQKISESVSGLSTSFSTLAEIGVTTETDGQLTFDESKLEPFLESEFDGIGKLFASENGLATSLDTVIEAYTGSSGILDSKTTGLNSSISDIGDQRLALNRRLQSIESRLLAQFTAMDILVNSLQNQSNFLTQQLGNLPGAFNPNRSN